MSLLKWRISSTLKKTVDGKTVLKHTREGSKS